MKTYRSRTEYVEPRGRWLLGGPLVTYVIDFETDTVVRYDRSGGHPAAGLVRENRQLLRHRLPAKIGAMATIETLRPGALDSVREQVQVDRLSRLWTQAELDAQAGR